MNNVSLTVYPGEIRGLIGENGSGKSTVTSIVAGMQPCDSGTMTFKGQDWKPLSMIDALHRGIGMIVQESGTIQGITVAENIFLAETEKYRNKLGLINRKKMNSDATAVMKNIGVNDVTGDMLMQKLDFQTRKLVEIAKVIMKEPQILVIDETSTALSHDGRQILYNIMNKFRKENKSVIFISHDLDEIMEVCDTLTVLRDGQIIRTFDKDEFEAGAIRASMIGRELQGDYYRSDFKASAQQEVALRPLLRDIAEKYQLKAAKTIHFDIDCEEGCSVYADAFCLREILSNLVDNAVKYSNEEVLIILSGKKTEDETIVRVHDSGIGIPLSEQHKIFNKFERVASGSRKTGASGFGLGLNYVLQVVSAHGGMVKVESMEGSYSEFTLQFPLR